VLVVAKISAFLVVINDAQVTWYLQWDNRIETVSSAKKTNYHFLQEKNSYTQTTTMSSIGLMIGPLSYNFWLGHRRLIRLLSRQFSDSHTGFQ